MRPEDEPSDDPVVARTNHRTRRLTDKILVAFHSACDQRDSEVAEQLIGVLERIMARPRPDDIGHERRAMERSLVAGYERLWELRHPPPANLKTRR